MEEVGNAYKLFIILKVPYYFNVQMIKSKIKDETLSILALKIINFFSDWWQVYLPIDEGPCVMKATLVPPKELFEDLNVSRSGSVTMFVAYKQVYIFMNH